MALKDMADSVDEKVAATAVKLMKSTPLSSVRSPSKLQSCEARFIWSFIVFFGFFVLKTYITHTERQERKKKKKKKKKR